MKQKYPVSFIFADEYASKLPAPMDQRLTGTEQRAPIAVPVEAMQKDVITLAATSSGLEISDIADPLKVDAWMTQVVNAPLVGNMIRPEGFEKV